MSPALSALEMLLLWTGLTAGNFAYQAFGAHSWGVAAERSFFQFIAVLAVLIACKLR